MVMKLKESKAGNGEYYVVSLSQREVFVSRTMAMFIESQLNRWRPPKWIVFVDLFGSRVRALSESVWAVVQCSEAQRAEGRAFDRRCQREWESDMEEQDGR